MIQPRFDVAPHRIVRWRIHDGEIPRFVSGKESAVRRNCHRIVRIRRRESNRPLFKDIFWNHAADHTRMATVPFGLEKGTGLRDQPNEDEEELEERYGSHIAAEAQFCEGERVEDEIDHSNMFNLLIANERAVNAAAMLEDLVPREMKSAFAIKDIPWCSHAAMVSEQGTNDGRDPAKGLMNRRAEVCL